MSERPYVEWSIASFLERLAGAEAEPGGGSAAALAGAIGAALVTMVTNLTLGKEKYADVQDDIAGIMERAEHLRGELEGLITLDAQAYGLVAAALKLPRETAAQTKERERVLQGALREAAEVPLRVAEAAAEVARLSRPAAEKGNRTAVSDAGVAVLLADAAAQSAALNVKCNLAWISDKGFKRDKLARLEAVLSETAKLREAVLDIVEARI